MVLFNYTSKELTAKIVYYGPGLCGKTTNLQFIYENLPGHVKKGKMLSLATKTDRTLFFDFLPIELGRIRGMKTRVQLYTVPGQVFYNSTRKLVLKGADGVVFVADSQQKMMESNGESYKNLEDNLKEIGLRLEEMPLVMQFNKRDLPHLASVEEMNTQINRHNAPFYEAVATSGIGVEDTLKAVTKLVLNHLAVKYSLGSPETRPSSAEAAASSTGIGLSADPGEMEIERIPRAAAARETGLETGMNLEEKTPASNLAAADDASLETDLSEPEADAEASFDHDAGEGAESAMGEELEVTDLGEVDGPPSPLGSFPALGASAKPERTEDLSDLLEEIPAGTADDPLSLDESIPAFRARPSAPPKAPAAPERTAAWTPPAPSVPRESPIPELPPIKRGAPAARPSPQPSISPLDPLGIAGRDGSAPTARAIQVGAVTPGREHQITVPLELSVEGRKVRLNLKMTLTLSR
jgi:mutual gliding-motility protein MglA